MADIELSGLVPSLIITRLDRLSVKTILSAKKELSFIGSLSGSIDGIEFEGKGINFPADYIIHIQGIPNIPYTFYVSTRPSRWRNNGYEYGSDSFYYIDGTEIMDNSLVLHDASFVTVKRLPIRGEIRARKDLTHAGKAVIMLDGEERKCYECTTNVDGEVEYNYGLGGEIIEMDGEFKLKPRNGTAKRASGHYKLKGDWEAVLDGHVVAEAGSLSLYKDYKNVTPSFVRVYAQGRLVV